MGVDRVDFLATEAHPRDDNTSLYHGYVKGGKIYDSHDQVVDDTLGDANGNNITDFTTVYQQGTQLNGLTLNHLWNFDIVRYDDGTLAALWKARVNGTDGEDSPDHRMAYSRFDGTEWKATYLVKGGLKLYPDEQDYIGGAALDPDHPEVIYLSTPYDPRDDTTNLGKHEIWKGVTCDSGATFTWTPIHHELHDRQPASRHAQMGRNALRIALVPRHVPDGTKLRRGSRGHRHEVRIRQRSWENG